MTNGHPPQDGQPPPESYPQGGQPQYPQQGPEYPQQGGPPPGAYPQQPQQQGGYSQYPQAPNPYQSGPSGPRANFGRRLLAYILDFIIVTVPFVIILGLFGAFDDINENANRFQSLSPGDEILYALLELGIFLAYFTLLEAAPSGQTVGKMALGIRVIRQDTGGSIGLSRALMRNAVRILPLLVPVAGFFWRLLDGLWMLWDREKQALHDKAVKTLVVPVAAYPIQRQPDASQQQSYGQPPPGWNDPNPN